MSRKNMQIEASIALNIKLNASQLEALRGLINDLPVNKDVSWPQRKYELNLEFMADNFQYKEEAQLPYYTKSNDHNADRLVGFSKLAIRYDVEGATFVGGSSKNV